MKILKLLNRKYLSIIIAILLIASSLNSEEQPVDIWNIDKEKIENSTSKEVPNLSRDYDNQLTESDIYNMQNDKEVNIVRVDEDLDSKEIKIIGTFLPKQLNEEETKKICRDVIESVGASSMKDMGKIMSVLKSKHSDSLDFSKVSSIIKEFLNK